MSVSYYSKTTVTTTTTTSAGTTTQKTTTSSGDPNAAKLAAKFGHQLQQQAAKAQATVDAPPPPPPPPPADVTPAMKKPADTSTTPTVTPPPADTTPPTDTTPADKAPADKAPVDKAPADTGSSDSNTVIGNGKDNKLDAPETGGTVRGLGGNDTITDGKGDDTISGGKGDDTVVLKNGGTNEAKTGSGNDFVEAHAGKNTIETFSGTDTVVLSGGENTLNTGDDADSVALLGGKNEIDTGDGKDHVEIDGGHNTVWLGKDDDTVIVRGGNNTIFGEEGNDTVVLTGSRDNYTEIKDPDGKAYKNNATGEVTRVFQADVVFGAERDVVVEPETIPIGGRGNGDVTATPGKPGTDGGSTNAGNGDTTTTDNGAAGTNKPDGGSAKPVDITTLKAGDATDGGVFSGTDKSDDIDIKSGYRSAVNGGDGNDFFHVNGGATGVLDGGAGEDVFQLSGGRVDLLKGGEEDLAILSGNRSDYKKVENTEAGSTTYQRLDEGGIFTIENDVTVEFDGENLGGDTKPATGPVDGVPDDDPNAPRIGDDPDALPTVDTGNGDNGDTDDGTVAGEPGPAGGIPDHDPSQPPIGNDPDALPTVDTGNGDNGGTGELVDPTITLTAGDETAGGSFTGTKDGDNVRIEGGDRLDVKGLDGDDYFDIAGGNTGRLDGGEGNDTIVLGRGGVGLVSGGEGDDTVFLDGTKADYKEPFLNEDGSTRFERVDGTGTFSVALDVETIEFSDGTLAERAKPVGEPGPAGGIPDDDPNAPRIGDDPDALPTIDTGNPGGGSQQAPLIERRGTDSGFVQPFGTSDNARADNAGGATFVGNDQDNTITLVRGTGTVIGRGGEDTVILDGEASDYRTEDVRITDGDGTQEATRYIRNDGTADFIIADDVENTLFQDVGPNTTPPGVSVTPVATPDGGNGGSVDGGNGGNGNGGGTTSGGVTTGTTPSNIPAGVTGDGSVGNPFTVTTLSEDFRAPRDVENNIVINGNLGNVVFGGDLRDVFTINGGNFGTINGGRGNDQFIINGGSGFILGSAGTDTFIINNLDGRINLSGTAGDRAVLSGSAADWVAIPTNGNGTTYTRSSNAIQNEDGTFRAIDRNQVVVIPDDFVIEFSQG